MTQALGDTGLGSRPRLMILTDIGGDPDDQQSMIRLLVHSNLFEIEGLLATASGTPGELKEAVTRPDLIHEIIDAYGKVQARLSRHQPGFPSADLLRALVFTGNPERGRESIGEGKDTPASRRIIGSAFRRDARPLNLAIWGGQTDLGQALWRIKMEKGEDGIADFGDRVRIYDIADQDGLADWLSKEFKGLFYILNKAPTGRDKREAVFRGMYLDGRLDLTSKEWVMQNVKEDHGPLGALYPMKTWTSPNPHGVLKEGDTPSWFYFLRNGLNDSRHPEWGGWGGRFLPLEGTRWFRDAKDDLDGVADARASVWRWRGDFQNHFAARMDWCVMDFDQANHPPVLVVNEDPGLLPLRIKAKRFTDLVLSGEGSADPDGDLLTLEAFYYPEAGDSGLFLPEIKPLSTHAVSLDLSGIQAGKRIHLILRLSDDGEPALCAYRRVVVDVE